MSWVKLDDGVTEHRKIIEVGPMAAWLWVCGLAYCNRQKAADGFIPERAVPALFPLRRCRELVAKLLRSGLWEEAEGGYFVHDYHDFQPTAEEAEERRLKRSEAGKKGGLASAAARTNQANAKQVASSKPSKRQAKCLVNDSTILQPRPDPDPVLEENPPKPPQGGASPPAVWQPLTARPWYAEPEGAK